MRIAQDRPEDSAGLVSLHRNASIDIEGLNSG
jgi:hypothetical protein